MAVCGICGILALRSLPVTRGPIERMIGSLKGRGPDDTGIRLDTRIGFGATRLAMVGGTNSNQPIVSGDGRWWLVGNGEVYNYRELKLLPLCREYQFETDGDLEVAIPLLLREGPVGLSRLRGPFAMAIWDHEEQRLWLARDRWGERPLFISRSGGFFFFSSTIGSLVFAGTSRPTADAHEVAEFIGTGVRREGGSLICGIDSVRRGSVLEIGGGRESEHQSCRYATFPQATLEPFEQATFESVFDTSVTRCLKTDRPLGLALSGGIDSTALLLKTHDQGVRPYTLALEGREEDENLRRARIVSKRFGADLTEVAWRLPSTSELFQEYLPLLDEPTPEPIALHNLALARAMGEHCRGQLAGHGADEILAGYTRYIRGSGYSATSDAEPIALSAEFGWWRARAVGYWAQLRTHVLRVGLGNGGAERGDYHWEIRDLLARPQPDLPRAMQVLDILMFNSHELFVIPDAACMAFGMESRAPFLDHDLVSYCFHASTDEKIYMSEGKVPLRRLLKAADLLDITMLPKIGFDSGFGYNTWLDAERSTMLDIIKSGELAPLLTLGFYEYLLAKPTDPDERGHQDAVLWRAVAVTEWLSRLGLGEPR